MAAPTVFVSSTFYDLKYIRGNIEYFIQTLGYAPVLSEEGAVFYDPTLDAQDACLAEIPNCQMFVLVIGGRYGSIYHDEAHSVTNAEYKEAARLKLPIFALVEQGVYHDFQVWRANKGDATVVTKIDFPNTDDLRVFEFIDEVQGQAVNNALVPFRDWNDIESYLRQQWAGMLHAFLTNQNTVRQVTDTLEMLEDMNRQIEVLSTQILKSVGTESAKATARMYAKLLESRAMDDLKDIGANPTPSQVILNETFDDFAASIGVPWHPPEDPETSISSVGEISGERHRGSSTDYTRLRNELLDLLTAAEMSPEQLVAQERNDFSSVSSRRSRKSGPYAAPPGPELSLLDK